MHETQLRKKIIEIGRLCYQRNLLVAMDGNLSVRLPSGHILCTKAGCHKGFLTDDDLVVIDMNGKHLRGSGKPTSEMAMHLACYRARPDIKAVVHAHPPLSVAFTIANVSMAQCVLPEVVLTLGVVPTLSYETTGTQLLADKVGSAILNHNAVLMDRHGAVCVGSDLLNAFCNLETMEHTALITKTARGLGGVKELPPQEAIALRSMGLKRYGGPPSAVEKADEPCADLPQMCTGCTGCATPNPSGIAPKANMNMARIQVVPQVQSAISDHKIPSSMEDSLVEATLRALSQK